MLRLSFLLATCLCGASATFTAPATTPRLDAGILSAAPFDFHGDNGIVSRAHPIVPYSTLTQAVPLMFTDANGWPDVIARVTGLRFEGAHAHDDRASAGRPEARRDDDRAVQRRRVVRDSRRRGDDAHRRGHSGDRDGGRPRAAALAGWRIALADFSGLRNIVREAVPDARFVETRGVEGPLRAVANGDADATVIDIAFAHYALGNPYRGALVTSGVLSTLPVPHGMLIAVREPVLLGIVNRAIASLPLAELESRAADGNSPSIPNGCGSGGVRKSRWPRCSAGWASTLRAQVARRIAAERAMRIAKEEAETANCAKSTFLATMSHEIRTPMNAVLGLLELELRAPTERALATAHGAARDLLGMIDDLLDVAKIEAERLMLVPAPMELQAWLSNIVAIYEPAARAKGIALATTRRDASGLVWLLADAGRLRQIVGNLLSNAIKFTDTGAVTLDYKASPPANGMRAVSLSVTDTGVGIAPERQAALFAPFVRAHDGGDVSFILFLMWIAGRPERARPTECEWYDRAGQSVHRARDADMSRRARPANEKTPLAGRFYQSGQTRSKLSVLPAAAQRPVPLPASRGYTPSACDSRTLVPRRPPSPRRRRR